MKVSIIDSIEQNSQFKDFTCKKINIKNHKWEKLGTPSAIPTSYHIEFEGIDGTSKCMRINLMAYDCFIKEDKE